MGNSEEGKSAKTEKSSSPAPPDQSSVHVYPDWAGMQAYYGPRVPIPPYYNSAMAPGHTPHPYMWAPAQPMMAPYGTPYASMYPHGGVYAHPAVPMHSELSKVANGLGNLAKVATNHLNFGQVQRFICNFEKCRVLTDYFGQVQRGLHGSHPHAPGIPSPPAVVTPPSVETPTKSSANSEKGLMKKLKGFDGLAMSIGNGTSNPESAEAGDGRLSHSVENEACSDGSSVGRKRSRQRTPGAVGEAKMETGSSFSTGDTAPSSDKALAPVVAYNAAKTSSAQPCQVLPAETWLQNEREMKRERRKQSNRESARRSRLRKQAETEELARRVESLTSENSVLKSEINELNEKSEKLRLENAKLLEKLNSKHTNGTMLSSTDEKRKATVSTENLLSRVNNSGSGDRNSGEDGERNTKSGVKLHQLLGTSPSPRADAVAAG